MFGLTGYNFKVFEGSKNLSNLLFRDFFNWWYEIVYGWLEIGVEMRLV